MSGESLQDRLARLFAEAHAAAQAGELGSAIEAAAAAHDDWLKAGCPDSTEGES